jgi:hypothetical protein
MPDECVSRGMAYAAPCVDEENSNGKHTVRAVASRVNADRGRRTRVR